VPPYDSSWKTERGLTGPVARLSADVRQRICARAILILILASSAARAQNADELAKQLSNPIASLTSVPLQLNYDDRLGPGGDGDRTTLNIQPVIPVSLSEKWNLISRTILPITYQENIAAGSGSQFGTGDVLQSLFFSPRALTESGWTWGAGPALLLSTASNDFLGTGKWAAGPTAVALKQTEGGWTYGALVNHLWSYAGDSDRDDVSSTFLQPFLVKGIGNGRTIVLNTEATYDWKAAVWTVPINLGYSKVTRLGSQLVSYQGGVRYFATAPDGGPEWGLRFTFTLLYPK
jgi:hypothetical protein